MYYFYLLIFLTLILLLIIGISKKKPKLVIIILSILSLYTVLIVSKPIFIPFSSRLSNEELSSRLARGIFNYYTLDFFSTDSIINYKIISADIRTHDDEKYIDVTYNIKPTSYSYFDWNAGNGSRGINGWLNHKTTFFFYKKYGDFYFITHAGTGL